jgi:anti-sigma factor RsiW
VKNNKITCTEFEQLEMKLLDNELTDAEKAKMDEHTRHCIRCARDLELYTSLAEDMQTLPEPQIKADFTQNVMQSVHAIPQKNKGLAFVAMCAVMGAVSSVTGFVSFVLLNSGALTAMLYQNQQLTDLVTALSQANGRADAVVAQAVGLVGANTDSVTYAVTALVMIGFGIYSAIAPIRNKI